MKTDNRDYALFFASSLLLAAGMAAFMASGLVIAAPGGLPACEAKLDATKEKLGTTKEKLAQCKEDLKADKAKPVAPVSKTGETIYSVYVGPPNICNRPVVRILSRS